jgi:hypothetical protein
MNGSKVKLETVLFVVAVFVLTLAIDVVLIGSVIRIVFALFDNALWIRTELMVGGVMVLTATAFSLLGCNALVFNVLRKRLNPSSEDGDEDA